MSVILRLSDLKLRVHEKFFLCMQDMGRKLMSAVLFSIQFLKVCKFQHTCFVFLVITILLSCIKATCCN